MIRFLRNLYDIAVDAWQTGGCGILFLLIVACVVFGFAVSFLMTGHP